MPIPIVNLIGQFFLFFSKPENVIFNFLHTFVQLHVFNAIATPFSVFMTVHIHTRVPIYGTVIVPDVVHRLSSPSAFTPGLD